MHHEQAGFNIVLVLLNFMFVLASGSATAQVIILPLLMACAPPGTELGSMTVTIPRAVADCTGLERTVPVAYMVSLFISFGVSLAWFFLRGQVWIWMLQDFLSVFVCVLFVRVCLC